MRQLRSIRHGFGTACVLLALASVPAAPTAAQHFYASRVDLHFNRLYDYAAMTKALHDLVAAYPELLSIQSIGKSTGERDLWLVSLNNPETGADTDKTAMYIDGNIHGNEVQAAEVVLYSIWYLTKSYGHIDEITRLVDERAFYFMPMVNPDGREVWFHEPATPSFLRGGIQPTDNDYDGLYDEDGYDDLDGDGHITGMWREDPRGRFRRDPDDERFFERVERDKEPGGWTYLGSEGIDNDGDGSVNEDGPGGYDPNRNWPSDWRPNFVQYGAGDYPFSFPETRAIGQFLLAHPNVAGFQSYHNTGGMILRGPGASYIRYPGADMRVFEAIQKTGTELLPFYDAKVTYKDLYPVHGGEKGWAYEGLGIIGFTNELWTSDWMYYRSNPSREERRRFQDLVQFGESFVPYAPFEHPTHGSILVGGTKKWSSRVTPPWVLEEECHRNFAFTMYHADQMPRVAWGNVAVSRTAGGLWSVSVEVENDRLIPTILAMARTKRIGARDVLVCETEEAARVVASGTVSSWLPNAIFDAGDGPRPQRIWNADGIDGRGHRIFRFLVEGSGIVRLEYRSQKGGTIVLELPLATRQASRVDGR